MKLLKCVYRGRHEWAVRDMARKYRVHIAYAAPSQSGGGGGGGGGGGRKKVRVLSYWRFSPGKADDTTEDRDRPPLTWQEQQEDVQLFECAANQDEYDLIANIFYQSLNRQRGKCTALPWPCALDWAPPLPAIQRMRTLATTPITFACHPWFLRRRDRNQKCSANSKPNLVVELCEGATGGGERE